MSDLALAYSPKSEARVLLHNRNRSMMSQTTNPRPSWLQACTMFGFVPGWHIQSAPTPHAVHSQLLNRHKQCVPVCCCSHQIVMNAATHHPIPCLAAVSCPYSSSLSNPTAQARTPHSKVMLHVRQQYTNACCGTTASSPACHQPGRGMSGFLPAACKKLQMGRCRGSSCLGQTIVKHAPLSPMCCATLPEAASLVL